MDIFVHDDDWNEQFVSPEEWAADNAVKDGETFALVRATIHAKTTYRMESGRAVPQSLAFPEQLKPGICPKCGGRDATNFEGDWFACGDCEYEWMAPNDTGNGPRQAQLAEGPR